MTLSTIRLVIVTLTVLVLVSWLYSVRVHSAIRGGDPVLGAPGDFPTMYEPW